MSKDNKVLLVDHKKRVILQIDENGKVLFGRHKDMSNQDKKLLIEICEDMVSDIDKDELVKFLNFEKEDFCS